MEPSAYVYRPHTLSMAQSGRPAPSSDIRYIQEKIGLDKLPMDLEETARLRLEHTEASLKELGDMLSPKVGKSGVNHRLRKLSQIADDLREGKEE